MPALGGCAAAFRRTVLPPECTIGKRVHKQFIKEDCGANELQFSKVVDGDEQPFAAWD